MKTRWEILRVCLQQEAVVVGTEGGVCVREDPKGDWQTWKATGFRDREEGALKL